MGPAFVQKTPNNLPGPEAAEPRRPDSCRGPAAAGDPLYIISDIVIGPPAGRLAAQDDLTQIVST